MIQHFSWIVATTMLWLCMVGGSVEVGLPIIWGDIFIAHKFVNTYQQWFSCIYIFIVSSS